jgi:hypothetical protein
MEFTRRVMGAMWMDASTYEAIEADPAALRQAVLVVAGFGIAAGIGLSADTPTARAIAIATASALAGWLSWAAVVYHLGVRVFPEPQTRSDVLEIARTIGFSAAPGLLLVFLAVPVGRPLTFALVLLWMFTAMVIAVRQALDFTRLSRAIEVCLAGLIVVALVAFAISLAVGHLVS